MPNRGTVTTPRDEVIKGDSAVQRHSNGGCGLIYEALSGGQ